MQNQIDILESKVTRLEIIISKLYGEITAGTGSKYKDLWQLIDEINEELS